jgi:hypothetical protein
MLREIPKAFPLLLRDFSQRAAVSAKAGSFYLREILDSVFNVSVGSFCGAV